MLIVKKTSENAITWSITANTGRDQKRFYAKVVTLGGGGALKESGNTIVTFLQEGKPEFIELATDETVNLPAVKTDGDYIQIRANSNSSLISVNVEDDNLGIRVSRCFIGGDSYTHGSVIHGDPGSVSEFVFSANIDYSSNTTAVQRSAKIILTDNAGHSVSCIITQEAAEPVITVNSTSVDVPFTGGGGTIMVSSNDSWTVSTVENI